MEFGKKKSGMDEAAREQAEAKLHELKEFIRDEGGDPKEFLASAISGSTEESGAVSEEGVQDAELLDGAEPEANSDMDKKGKIAAAVASIKKKLI